MEPNAKSARIGNVEFGDGTLALIGGPCLAESLEMCLNVASQLSELCATLGIGYVFKASFDKANRSSDSSPRGPGLREGLKILAAVREKIGVPVLTDIHLPDQAEPLAETVDALQIPAFLCRQTDLLTAAGATGKTVNLKKGQFMAPWEMSGAVQKVRSAGATDVLLTDRGTFFGYNRLVSDLRAIGQMRPFGPVVFDATHSVQQPGGLGTASGGEREFAPVLAGAALAAGADALFIETHPNPDEALSDAACQIPLDQMPEVLARCLAIFRASRAPLG